MIGVRRMGGDAVREWFAYTQAKSFGQVCIGCYQCAIQVKPVLCDP